jgi:aminoglycoside phosphotransferase (APT) family kinase protein
VDTGATPGVDLDALAVWARTSAPELVAPFTGSLITGGRSNITIHLTDADGKQYVLRRPPLHSVLATAHDVAREHRIISALGPTPVPVPRTIAVCTDVEVIGAPFYVMAFVDGAVLDGLDATGELSADARAAVGPSMVDTLVTLHDVDPDAVGLGTLAKREGYVERQLKRWYAQWEATKQREVPAVDRAHDLLAAHVPEQREVRIAHGDFRAGNCIIGDDGTVRAVLDWELCTLGDPLADLGYLVATWASAEDAVGWTPDNPTAGEGFVARAALAERYAERSGRDVSELDFYVAFAFWRTTCILEGVYARYRTGAQGDSSSVDPEQFGTRVEITAALAEERAERFAATRGT